jgi:hypothetical protein
MVNLDPVAEESSNYSPASPSISLRSDIYELLVDQPPPSIFPSEASSVITSEASSVLPSEASSALASEASSALASEASSALASEVNSALASDSELPPLPSTKARKQTDLLNFFSKMPSDELHVKWQKRKCDNEDKDREEYVKRKQKNEAENLHKLTTKGANNQVSQKKRRDRLQKEKATLSKVVKDSSVSLLI